jgi:hypothetical protein
MKKKWIKLPNGKYFKIKGWATMDENGKSRMLSSKELKNICGSVLKYPHVYE